MKRGQIYLHAGNERSNQRELVIPRESHQAGSVNKSVPFSRVLLLITDSHIGGTEKIVSLLARNLDRRRYQPVVCSVKPPGAMAAEVMAAGVEFFSLDFRGRGLPGLLRAAGLVRPLAREIESRRVDLVHSFLFLANMLGRLAASRLGLPNISSLRGEDWGRGYPGLLERLSRRLAAAYVTPSRALAERAATRYGIPREKITVIPNAVEEPQEAAPELRPLLGIERGRFLAGVVGRLHPEKGVDVLFEALALLPPGERPMTAVIGDGPDRLRLEKMAKVRGLDPWVRFTGWRPGASSLIRELDLLVLPSRSEGLPNAVLEAMAAGVPVLAARVGGVPELIEEGRTGFLVPPEDPEALAAALLRLIRGEVGAAVVAREAAALVAREHAPALMLQRYQDLYDKMLAGGIS